MEKLMRTRHSLTKKAALISAVAVMITMLFFAACVYYFVADAQGKEAVTRLAGIAEAQATMIEEDMIKAETSVNDMVALSDEMIKSVDYVKDKGTRQAVFFRLREIFLGIMKKSDYAVANYFVFNPELTGETDGVLYVREDGDEPKERKILSKLDSSHYDHISDVLVEKGKSASIWVEPYYNEAIEKWVLSYITSFYKDDTLVAIMGMDFDFEQMTEKVGRIRFLENGYAFLKNAGGTVHYHPAFFEGDKHGDELDINQSTVSFSNGVSNVVEYTYNGGHRIGVAVPLRCGLQLFFCDAYDEVFQVRNRIVNLTIILSILAMLVNITLSVLNSRRMIKPIMQLTGAVKEIEAGNYATPLPKESDDEIGVLTRGIWLMEKTLSERKKYSESELARRNKELEEAVTAAENASRAKTDFFSQMSHDIRTPMNAIVGMTLMARDNIDDKEKLADCLDKIDSSGNFLLALINDILDMSRIESGRFTISSESVNIPKMIDRTITIMSQLIEQRHHRLHSELRDIVHANVISDGLRLQQIMVNILSNSVKYTPEGGELSVEVTEIPCDIDGYARFRFVLSDNGIGMSKEYIEKLFVPFSREADEHNTNVRGTGLGMAITKSVIDMMHGSITVESEPGRGTATTIDLTFPIDHSATACEQPADTEEKTGSASVCDLSAVDLTGRRILAVDDVEINREIAQYLLEMTGAEVDTAENGREALDMFLASGDKPYDIILMDIYMPVMSGYDATQAIRASQSPYAKTIPIVAMSANAFDEDKLKSKEIGMNDHIIKPLEIAHLAEVLHKYVLKV